MTFIGVYSWVGSGLAVFMSIGSAAVWVWHYTNRVPPIRVVFLSWLGGTVATRFLAAPWGFQSLEVQTSPARAYATVVLIVAVCSLVFLH